MLCVLKCSFFCFDTFIQNTWADIKRWKKCRVIMWSFQITGRIGHVWEFGIQRQAESSTCQHLVRPHQKYPHPPPHQPALLCTYMWSRLLQSCWKGENLPVQEIWVEYTRCSNNLYCYFWYLSHTFYMHEHNGFSNSRDWMILFPALLLYFRWCSYSCHTQLT